MLSLFVGMSDDLVETNMHIEDGQIVGLAGQTRQFPPAQDHHKRGFGNARGSARCRPSGYGLGSSVVKSC